MVTGDLNLLTGQLTNIDLSLASTKPDKSNKTVRKNSQDLLRARTLYQSMTQNLIGVDMVFVEIPVGSQTARAMASYGMCIGILASIDIPMIQVTPTEVKVAATGNRTATKNEMIKWATSAYPDVGWITRKHKGKQELVSKNEHLADALAAIYAGVKTDEFRQARSIISMT